MRLTFLIIFLLKCGLVIAQKSTDVTNSQCIEYLQKVLHKQSEWIKAHAAEYLIRTKHAEGVRAVFLNEERNFGKQSPYRIGIWRVLAQTALGQREKDFWAEKIKKTFLDTTATDRLHAAEALAKLHISTFNDNPVLTGRAIRGADNSLSIYTSWSAASQSSLQHSNAIKAKLLSDLENQDRKGKSMIAYALRHLGNLSEKDWQNLAKTAFNEPEDSPAKVYLLSSAWVTGSAENKADKKTLIEIYSKLLTFKTSKSKADRTEMAMALAEKGTAEDLPVLISLFKNENPLDNAADNADVASAAAYAILKIKNR